MKKLELKIHNLLTVRSEEGDYIEISSFINEFNDTINELIEEIKKLKEGKNE